MKRRGHRKSRHGCQECKRRHIKCDEGRPQCANCTITGRRCDFGDRRSTQRASATHVASPHPASPRTPALAAVEEPSGVIPQEDHDDTRHQSPTPDASAPVNLHHMELLAHYTFAVSNPEIDPDLDRAATKMVVQTALAFPWLLYEILAISSRHLATLVPPGGTGPRSAAFYRAQASQLQTQALHLFNRRGGSGGDGLSPAAIDETNCAAAVLFSSTLGRHLLADTLEDLCLDRHRDDIDSKQLPAYFSLSERLGEEQAGLILTSRSADDSHEPDRPDAEAALDRYCRYLQVHLGLRAVASSSWSHLMESDLWPLIALAGRIHTSRSGARGTELRSLSRWVEGTGEEEQGARRSTRGAAVGSNNDEEEECRKVCQEAIDLLQIGPDESSPTGTSSSFSPSSQHQQHQMTFTWPVRCPAKFGELIRRRSPRALVVLAHYAVLLHRSRDLWPIGPSAPRFLQVISDVLGPGEYEAQLEWPRAVVLGGQAA